MRPDRNALDAAYRATAFFVDGPGGQSYIVPDVVLFVNGIPLVVVECKSPASTNPIESAITQLLRYANQRDEDAREGAEQLFHFNQLTVATCFEKARLGTVGASYEHGLKRRADKAAAEVELFHRPEKVGKR